MVWKKYRQHLPERDFFLLKLKIPGLSYPALMLAKHYLHSRKGPISSFSNPGETHSKGIGIFAEDKPMRHLFSFVCCPKAE